MSLQPCDRPIAMVYEITDFGGTAPIMTDQAWREMQISWRKL